MRHQRTRLAIVTMSICVAFNHAIAQPNGAITIGGFDVSRGGVVSFAEGDSTQAVREAVLCAFPNATVSGSPILSSTYLRTLDVVFLTSTSGFTRAISPLTTAEQDALRLFVLQGGTALVFVDNNSFAGNPASSIANQSLLDPFGVVVSFNYRGTSTVHVSNASTSAVTSGMFGTIDLFDIFEHGLFTSLGQHAQSLGTIDGGGHVFIEITESTLGAASGPVVIWADSSFVFNPFFADIHGQMIKNAVDLAPRLCYADCDISTGIGTLDIFDFLCFQNAFVSGECYADCDRSTGAGTFDIFDFLCFQDAFVRGCP